MGWVERVSATPKILAMLVMLVLTSQSHATDVAVSPLRVDISFENWQMSLLARVKSAYPDKLIAFHTDGCSGGLSDGWKYVAQAMPAFSEKFGESPPWEYCCVEHDRAYWRGETENGYNLRLNADLQLRACVEQFGNEQKAIYAKRFSLQPETVQHHINIGASLMYRAVRLGGKPCSFLPWRWGYGWPHCIQGYKE